MSKRSRLHLTIHGKVQGVFYRTSAKDKAEDLLLTGWIRNIQNNTVEAELEGDRENLEKFLNWCYAGPDLAEVTKVESNWLKYKGEFTNVTIL
ncbi:MAG: acylphosphatase [Bdellovibrionales bacterium]|nr:acylphosphatase [Bdellovibrionales bacterium]